jgi:hypothetical protein
MRVVEGEVESTMISNFVRELFMGFIGLLMGTWSSSSSAARFRFVDLNAVGSMFSASDSPRGCLLPERMAPIHVKVLAWTRKPHESEMPWSYHSAYSGYSSWCGAGSAYGRRPDEQKAGVQRQETL